MSRQISYFIEGGDNVGKTTLINYIKEYKKYEESMGFIFNIHPFSSLKKSKFIKDIIFLIIYEFIFSFYKNLVSIFVFCDLSGFLIIYN